MRTFVIAGVVLASTLGSAHASVFTFDVGPYTIKLNTMLPNNTFTPNLGPDSFNVLTDIQGDHTNSSGQLDAKSPFGSSSPRLYDAVLGGGSAFFGNTSASGTSTGYGTGSGSFSFIWGTPDQANNIIIFDQTGSVAFSGTELGSYANGAGSYLATISGLGTYKAVELTSSVNSFEFAGVSAVPLPASAPLFGAGLIALAGLGFAAKRKKAAPAV